MSQAEPSRDSNGCWRGRDDPRPFTPGLPVHIAQFDTLDGLFREMVCCTRCDLALARKQVVVGTGPASARLMVIGEAPGAQEDDQGKPFVGRAGRLLDRLLEQNGLDREQVFITNVVACRPPSNRAPRVREVNAHVPWLEEQLRLVLPDVIVTLGRVALAYFIPGAKVTELRGVPQVIERSRRGISLLPMLHPAAALRRRELLPLMEEDFAKLPVLLP